MRYLSMFLILCSFASIASADVDQGSMVAISQCSYDASHYCINISGSALKTDTVPGRFDTGGNRLLMPIGCVNMDNVKVLSTNTHSQLWNRPAELVEGQISLRSVDNETVYSVNDFKFYVDKTKPDCNNFTIRSINFGAGAMLTYDKTAKQYLGSFFTQYHYPANLTPGYTLLPANAESNTLGDNFLLQLGADPIPSTMFSISLQTMTTLAQPCGSANANTAFKCLGFTDATHFNFGYVIPNATVQLAGDAISSNSVTISSVNTLMDSGGGLMLIDDTDGSLFHQLNSALQDPPRYLPWLKNCKVLAEGTNFSYDAVDSKGHHIHYAYTVQAPKRGDQSHSVAVCHRRNMGHWVNHGVNVGYAFFSNASKIIVRLDPKQGAAIGIATP